MQADGIVPPMLYATGCAGGYTFCAFSLPIHTGQAPSAIVPLNEPIPVAADGRDVFVGSYDDNRVYEYALPLTASSRPIASVPVFAPGGLVARGKFLYAITLGSRNLLELVRFHLPIQAYSRPTVLIVGRHRDGFNITSTARTLYVARWSTTSVSAYALPMTHGEKPEYTLRNIFGDVAVTPHETYLYVTRDDAVLEYHLPYKKGEEPAGLTFSNLRNVSAPGSMAVWNGRLFVTAGSCFLSYALPFARNMLPIARVGWGGGPTSLALGD